MGYFKKGAWVDEPVLFYCPVCKTRGEVRPVRCTMKCENCHNILILTDRKSYVDDKWYYHIRAEDYLISSITFSMGPYDEPLSNP